MNVRFLKPGEKKKLFAELKETFGIDKPHFLLFETGKEKIRGFAGSMSKEEILKLGEITNVEVVGLYLFKDEGWGYRLSHDAVHILAGDISKGIIEINEGELGKWIRGHDLEIVAEKGAVVLRFGDDFVGCGVSNGEKIFNYVPNERRIRSK